MEARRCVVFSIKCPPQPPPPSLTWQSLPTASSFDPPNHKGKGKACDDKEDMAIDPAHIPLPGDDKDDAEGELKDNAEADPMSDLSAAE
ncbi:hypothetical protein H2248_004042 [Termitomyces sp. 'cryptogamus']|nr:hypothetical protein H2248_004042 [Termitomyces sp. 'cryptogamus']